MPGDMPQSYQPTKRWWSRSATFTDYDSLTSAAAADSPTTQGSVPRCSHPGSHPANLPHIRTRKSTLGTRLSETPGPAYPFSANTDAGASLLDLWKAVTEPMHRAHTQACSFTFTNWMQLCLPCLKWLKTYNIREYLLWDIIAGISVGFMVVPQGMSYAHIAGVPSVYGLYGAFMPVLVYALFGSSKELAVGPVAVTSLLISSSLKQIVPGAEHITNPNDPPTELVHVQEQYNQRAIQLSLLVACFYTAVGVLNLGFLTNFLSHSVIGGFTSGAAITIGMSQLKYILGYSVPRADRIQDQIHDYLNGIHGFVWQECIMGLALLSLLLVMKHFGKRHHRLKWLRPLGPISACSIAIIAVIVGDLETHGIKTVGRIPKGLPSPTVSWWLPMDDFTQLAPLALVVMLVDLLESTSIARALAAKGAYELNTNQEIMGLGLANFAGSAFNAYSTTGSFSRSAVNYDSGCKSGVSGFVTACVVGLVLMVLTPVFERLPLNVMGAIVISGVSGLFEYQQAVHLFKVRKLDWLVWITSWLGTMLLGVETGLAIAIGLALLIVIYESAFPHTALLGRVGNTTIYRNVKQFPNSQVLPGIAACRVDAPMYFANVQYIHERLRKYVKRAAAYSEAAGLRLQYLLLDMSPVTHLDSTGADLLGKIHAELRLQGIQLGLCNPGAAVVNLLERTAFPDALGRDWIFVRMHDAVQRCLAHMIADGYTIKPTTAIHSTAMSPKHVEALRNSPLGRHSSLGGPADTEATWLSPFGPFASACEPLMSSSITLTSSTEVAVATADAQPGATARIIHADFAAAATAASEFGVHSMAHSVSNPSAGGAVLSMHGTESSLHGSEYRRLEGTPRGAAVLQQPSSRRGTRFGAAVCSLSQGLGSGSNGSFEQRLGEVVLMADGADAATAGNLAAGEAPIAAPVAVQEQTWLPERP